MEIHSPLPLFKKKITPGIRIGIIFSKNVNWENPFKLF